MFKTAKPRFYVAVITATALLGSFSVNAAEITVSPETVKEIQKKLNQDGYNAGPVDGKVGQTMVIALKSFQKDNELDETGQLNFRTLKKMNIDLMAMGEAQASPPDTADKSAEEIGDTGAQGADASATEAEADAAAGEKKEDKPDAAKTEPAAGDQTTTDMIDNIQKKDNTEK